MKQDDYLRQALSQLAEEETEQFARSMSREDRRNAETLFKQHKRRVFSLIARMSKHHGKGIGGVVLRIAAMLIVVVGGVYLATHQTPPDITPLSPGHTVSVAPYYSSTPGPTEQPTPEPTHTSVPTDTPVPTQEPTIIPTETPLPTSEPTPTPTNTPAPTKAPTVALTLTPAPTAEPTAQPEEDLQPLSVPMGWGGAYFPDMIPSGYLLTGTSSENGMHTAVYSNGLSTITFTESETLVSIPLSGTSDITYVQWDDVVALMSLVDGQHQVTWDQGGHSFALLADGGTAEAMCATVKKISK
ncbi:MAG: hypothetical protein IJ189_08080 [Clostridia bacterium]|nr:hypothetical protein [Clostridia bacterium]